jgi:hypothetical protein
MSLGVIELVEDGHDEFGQPAGSGMFRISGRISKERWSGGLAAASIAPNSSRAAYARKVLLRRRLHSASNSR